MSLLANPYLLFFPPIFFLLILSLVQGAHMANCLTHTVHTLSCGVYFTILVFKSQTTSATLLIPTQYLEPVNGTAVDKRWKLAQAISKGVSNRTEGHNNVQVLSTACHEEGEQSQRTQLQILITSLGNGTYRLKKEGCSDSNIKHK